MFTGNIYYRGDKTAAEDVLHEATQLANKSVAKKEYLGAPNFREQFTLSSGATLDVVINEHQQFMTIVGFGGELEELVELITEEEEEKFALYTVRPKKDYPQAIILKVGEAIKLEWADNIKAGYFNTQHQSPAREDHISFGLDGWQKYTNTQTPYNIHTIDGPGMYLNPKGSWVFLNGYKLVQSLYTVIGACIVDIPEGTTNVPNGGKLWVYANLQTVSNNDPENTTYPRIRIYSRVADEIDYSKDPETYVLTERLGDGWLNGGGFSSYWYSGVEGDGENLTLCSFSEDGLKGTVGMLDYATSLGGQQFYNNQNVFNFTLTQSPITGRVYLETANWGEENNEIRVEHKWVTTGNGAIVPETSVSANVSSQDCLGYSRITLQGYTTHAYHSGSPSKTTYTATQDNQYSAALSTAADGQKLSLDYEITELGTEEGWGGFVQSSPLAYYSRPNSLDNRGICPGPSAGKSHLVANYDIAYARYISTLGSSGGATGGSPTDSGNDIQKSSIYKYTVTPGTYTWNTVEFTYSSVTAFSGASLELTYLDQSATTFPSTAPPGEECVINTYYQVCTDTSYTTYTPQSAGTATGTASQHREDVTPVNFSLRHKYFINLRRTTPYADNSMTLIPNPLQGWPTGSWSTTPVYTCKASLWFTFDTATGSTPMPGLDAFYGDLDFEYNCLTAGGNVQNGNVSAGTSTETYGVPRGIQTSTVPSNFCPRGSDSGKGYVLFSLTDYYLQVNQDSWYTGKPLKGILQMYEEDTDRLYDILAMYNKLLADTDELLLDEISPILTTYESYTTFMYEAGVTGDRIPEPTIDYSKYNP